MAQSHIYPSFTGKVSTKIHFPLEPGYGDYSILDQAVKDFDQGLDSILTDSSDTPELHAFLGDAGSVPSLVSSGFLHLVSTVSHSSIP